MQGRGASKAVTPREAARIAGIAARGKGETPALAGRAGAWQAGAMQMLADLRLTRAPAAAFAAMGVFWGAVAATAPALKARAGLGDAELGLALLMATGGAALALLVAGRADRAFGLGATRLAALALGGALALLGLATTPLALAGALLLGGVATGLLDVTVNLRLARLEALAGRGLMNLAHGLYAFAYAGAALGAGLAREAGAALPALLAAAALVPLALALPIRGRDGDAGVAETRPAARAALAPGLVAAGGAVMIVGFLAEGASDGWAALHLERTLGAGAAAGALGPVILGLALGTGRIAAQALLRLADEARLLRAAAGLAALGTALAAAAPGLALTYAGFAAMGLGASVVVPLCLALVGRGAGEAGRPRAIAAVSFIGYGAFFFGPPLMGLLAEWQGLRLSFAAVAASLALVPLVLGPWLARAAGRG